MGDGVGPQYTRRWVDDRGGIQRNYEKRGNKKFITNIKEILPFLEARKDMLKEQGRI